jgi:signal transduction histidine kinase
MKITLRQRIIFTLVPLFVLLSVLGGAGALLLYSLGGRIDEILRENYDSVIYMKDLNEAVERIDSSFTFTLAGEEARGRRQFKKSWLAYRDNLGKEQRNITLPGERELVERLTRLSQTYEEQGAFFYNRKERLTRFGVLAVGMAGMPDRAGPLAVVSVLVPVPREQDYFQPGGLLDTFQGIKKVSEDIYRLNQENMEEANRDARATAHSSLVGFIVGLAVSAVLAVLLVGRMIRAIVQPIRAVTESAQAIGTGDLNQVVPVAYSDELGRLAGAFNAMARQLRDYRHSHEARLLRAQQTSQATIDSFPDPVLVVDGEGHVELANPAARHLLGVRADGDARLAVAWQPPETLRQPLAAALKDQRPFLPEGFDQAVVLREQGKDRFFLPRLLPIRDPYGHTLGAAVLLADVTRFRLLDEVKSNLVATASHELKTPLTSIRLAIHLLLEETIGSLSPKQLELVLDARDNSERLLAMIDNLLDLARLEEGGRRLDLSPESPGVLLKTVAEALRPRAEDSGVELVVEAADDLPQVAVDFPQMRHALDNLLGNALRYTRRGGRVTLKAEAETDAVAILVSDTGAGIPPEYLPHVFEKFFQIPGRTQPGSTGLGLALVREIVTAHGGTVTCRSRPGEGTEFTILLPICGTKVTQEKE